MKKSIVQTNQGFTLLELIVAGGLFIVVMLISMGSLLTIIESNREAQAIKSVMNNVNFAMDSMTRALRIGTDYVCEGVTQNECANDGTDEVAFEGVNGDTGTLSDQIRFRFIDERLERSTDNGSTFLPLTDELVTIENARFYVDGTGANEQPRILIVLQGSATANGTDIPFNIQTLISQRLLNQ